MEYYKYDRELGHIYLPWGRGRPASEVEYTWGIIQRSDRMFYATWSTTNNKNEVVQPGSNPWIKRARDDGTLYGYGHLHTGEATMSGYGNGTGPAGQSDQSSTYTWKRSYVVGTDGEQNWGDTQNEHPFSIPGISEKDIADLLKCLGEGK
jgi:hypothetical protein